jgi:hypothetical protein
MLQNEEISSLLSQVMFCGCGCPEEALQYVGRILAAIRERKDSAWTINNVDAAVGLPEDHPAYWVLFYHLDACHLIEHGGNVSGCWLTAKGEEVLARCSRIQLDE